MATAEAKRRRDGALSKRLKGKRVCICLGSGGVGKTTTSAALALGLAARGQKVAVVTIDPAARLASALGLERLSGEPRLIEPSLLAEQGVDCTGELWAMMLDSKATFDEIVARLAPDGHEREQILANPIYRELSSAVAGSQELSAMAKLYELRHERDFDVIVLDTPPSRNAVDFLETPTRLLGFLEGRALKVFLSPGGLAARRVRALDGDRLCDLRARHRRGHAQRLVDLLSLAIGDPRRLRRAHRGVAELLRDPTTTFLVVTSPEPEPAHEAEFLAERLAERGMSRGGLIVNRVHFDGLGDSSVEQVQALLAPDLGERLARRVAGNLADFDVLVQRDRKTVARLSRELDEREPILVPHLDEDVRDLAGLARLAEHLFS